MIVDSHAHVSSRTFRQDQAQVLERARAAGLVALVDVGVDLAWSRDAAALAARDPMIWATAGVHPHEAKHFTDATPDALAALAGQPRVVAIGEIGLDFHYNRSPPDVQRHVFRAQLALALDLDLPVVLHLREAYDEALGILDEVGGRRLRGVAHCFTGDAPQAEAFVRQGFFVSFSGVVTYRSAAQVQEAARRVPADRLLVETDCPFLAPVPLRGQRCEPAHVVHTARALARLRGEDEEGLLEATARNTAALFGFELPGG